MALALAGCWGALELSRANEGRPTDGPLLVSGGSGGQMILGRQPRSANQTAVFGGLMLCSDSVVTLDAVRYEPASAGTYAETVLRTVPLARSRANPRSSSWAPLSATRSSLSGDRFARKVPGEITRGLAGLDVDQRCGPSSPGGRRLELLTSVTADPGGLFIKRLHVDYTVDGDEFTTPVEWSFVLCGDTGDYEGCS